MSRQIATGGPVRIQRRRIKGWRAPAGAVYVGRGSKWGNPWAVVRCADGTYAIPDPFDSLAFWPTFDHESEARAEAVRLFNLHVGPMGLHEYDAATLTRLRVELTGRDLMCWCPLTDASGARVPCHADVLLELANSTGGA